MRAGRSGAKFPVHSAGLEPVARDHREGRERAPAAAGFLALVALAYFPYSQWFAQHYAAKFFGFSVFATVLPTTLGLSAALDLALAGRLRSLRLGAGLACVAVIVGSLRLLSGLDASLAQEVSNLRWLILIPLWASVMHEVLSEAMQRRRAVVLLVGNTLIAAGMGVAYHAGWARIRIIGSDGLTGGIDPFARTITRASGLWVNPNAYAAFLLLGVVLVLLVVRTSVLWTPLALALLAAGIGASGSRWPLVGALLLLLNAAMPSAGARSRGFMRVARYPVVALGVWVLLLTSGSALGRLATTDGGDDRLLKSSAGWHALVAGPETILLGGNPGDLAVPRADGIVFSDNGWLQMALSAGIPATGAFLAVLWGALRFHRGSRGRFVAIGVMAATMTVNNANLWDPWLVCAAATYWLACWKAPACEGRGVSSPDDASTGSSDLPRTRRD